MTNPRHLFILLGFLAQGLTWEFNPALILVAVVWALAVTKLHCRYKLPLWTEAAALVIGCLLSYATSRILHRSAHFFLGDGLLLLQLFRLMRPLKSREKLTSLIIAAFHFGVLCTLAPNIRFVILFTSALFVLPGALKETFLEAMFPDVGAANRCFKFRLVPTARVALWLLLGSGFVFISFPRFTGSPLQLRESFADRGSLLDAVLDPRRSGQANSQQILMQIEGDRVGYLRCFSLTEFNGTTWQAERNPMLLPYQHSFEGQFSSDRRFLVRRVHVKNSQYLGGKIPFDGVPVFIRQNFFARPGRSPLTGAVEPAAIWTTGNNVYEYYIDSQPEPEILPGNMRAPLLEHPPQSDQLKDWLAVVSANGTNALQRSRLVESHMRSQFRYQLGTPELSRLTPINDFIFNRKEGHCERFAASMALFLRMEGIPSRVVIGYVATTRNLFTGRLQVRFRDAHSWAEGYFEGLGWVTFDATPGSPDDGTGSDFRDMLEALDFAWYSHVVNFNGFAQQDLMAGSARLLGRVPDAIWQVVTWAMILLLGGGVAFRFGKKHGWKWNWPRRNGKRTVGVMARHQYDKMLNLVARKGLMREKEMTPHEFEEHVQKTATPIQPEVAAVTASFCRTFYGEKLMSTEEVRETELALKRLKEQCSGKNEKSETF